MNVRVHVLGDATVAAGPDVVRPPVDRRSALLWFLVVTGEAVTRERLGTLLWPEATTADARRNLRTLLMRARRLPYARDLQSDGDHVRWDVPSDLAAFRRALAVHDWEGATARYAGELLPGVTLDGMGQAFEWLVGTRLELHEAFRRAALARAEQLRRDAGAVAVEALVAHYDRVLAVDPLDEVMALRAIEDLSARSRHADARRIGRTHRERVRRDLGLEPDPRIGSLLARMEERIVVRDPSVSDAQPSADPAGLPLPRPATAFVDRPWERRRLARLLARRDCRLLTVTGTLGVGKTRLALRVAEEVADRYPEGVAYVDLSRARDAATTADALVAMAAAGRRDGPFALVEADGVVAGLLSEADFAHALSMQREFRAGA